MDINSIAKRNILITNKKMSYTQNNFKKIQLKVRGDFLEIFHCLRNLDESLSGLKRQKNNRGFFEYHVADLEKINKIFEINGIHDEEIALSDLKITRPNIDTKGLIDYKVVNNNVILRFSYDKIIIDMLKLSKFRRWHSESKRWEIGLQDFDTFKTDIEQKGYHCIKDTENSDRNQSTPKKRPLEEYLLNKVINAPSKNRKITEDEQKRLEAIPESLKRWQQEDFKSIQPASPAKEEEEVEDELDELLKTM